MKSIFTSASMAAMFASGLAQVTIDLGTAATFALVAVGGVNNLGPSGTITGNVGTTGHLVDGFAPGAIDGVINVQNAAAAQARADALAVYNQLHPLIGQQVESTEDGTIIVTKGMGDDDGNGTTNFTGAVFTPGIYNIFSIFEVITNVTLSGAGQFIFTSGSHFRMAPGSEIILTNGAQVGDVFFAAGDSANISTGAHFQGKLFSDSGMFMGAGATATGGLYGGGIVNITDSTITLEG
jgi:hypothetical protein